MALFKLFKKKNVPSELPDLISDDFEKKVVEKDVEKDADSISNHLKEEVKKESKVEDKKEEVVEKSVEPSVVSNENVSSEKSFFRDLENNLNSEIEDLDKLESWYENKFVPQDVVSDMRSYWENQKTQSVLKILGKNFKERISTQTHNLQKLEGEWQNIYFDLIAIKLDKIKRIAKIKHYKNIC